MPRPSQAASTAELTPRKLEGTMAFMFESRHAAARHRASPPRRPQLQPGYADCWAGLREAVRHPARAMIDHTHDPSLQSWVACANGHADFPIQNLPLGVFSPLAGAPRGGIAIGDDILDLRALHEAALLDDEAQAAAARLHRPEPEPVPGPRRRAARALRDAVSALLQEGSDERPHLLHRAADCIMYMPAHVGDYTDFYAGIHHATTVGSLFRPDTPLLPNYKYVPDRLPRPGQLAPAVGAEVRRPNGPAQAGQRSRARPSAPAATSTTSSSSASGSAPATRWAPPSRSPRPPSTSPATAC